jgi:hypothetical protein
MRPLKLFYSWQMDRSSKLCRDFIRRALDEAAAILATKGFDLQIDSDTHGVAGTPPITETILRKIRENHLFLGDMTFVAQAGDKLIPNPNVMGEYGYALHAKGNARILLVMNTAFGPPEKLPFDLHHLRHPEQYDVDNAAPDGARRKARSDFGARLADHILAAAKEVEHEMTATARQQRETLHATWWTAVQARQLNDRPSVIGLPSALVHVVSLGAVDGDPLDPRLVRGHLRGLRLGDGAVDGADGRQWWSCGPQRQVGNLPNPVAQWYGRLRQPGVVEFEQTLGERIEDDPTTVLKGTWVEASIVEAADRGLELAQAIGLEGPHGVGVVIYGLDDVELQGHSRTRRFRTQTLDLPISLVPQGVTEAGDYMRQAFDQLWMSAGFGEGSPSFATSRWAGYSV